MLKKFFELKFLIKNFFYKNFGCCFRNYYSVSFSRVGTRLIVSLQFFFENIKFRFFKFLISLKKIHNFPPKFQYFLQFLLKILKIPLKFIKKTNFVFLFDFFLFIGYHYYLSTTNFVLDKNKALCLNL